MSATVFAYRVRSSLHMSAISLLLGLLLGIVIGAAIGFLYARGRLAAASADASARARAAEQRAALVDGHLAERFEALSAQALDASTARFLEVAEGRLQAANANAAGELETPPGGGRAPRRAAEGDPGPGRGPAAGVGRGPDPLTRRAGRAGRHRPADFRAAAGADPGPGHRAAAAGGPGPVGRAPAAPGGRAGRDERALRLRRAGRPDLRGRPAAPGHGGAPGGRQEHRGRLEGLARGVPGGRGERKRGRARRPDGGARAASAGPRGPAGGQGVLGRAEPVARVRHPVHPGRGVPGAGAGTRPGAAGVRPGPQGPHRHAHHAGHDAAHGPVRLAAGGAGGQRAGRVRPRPRAVRPDREPWPARGPPGPRADHGRVHLQPDGRLAGEPGAGHGQTAERAGRRRRRPRAPGAGRGDDPGSVRARAAGQRPG